MSDQLGRGGRDGVEARLFGWSRPNVLRSLTPPAATDRVLEVGSAAGTVTRWLAEHGCLVDGLEPSPAMADSARLRCEDLNAWVMTTRLSDVPASAAYDLVVDIEGLAHVGQGTPDPTPYVARLTQLASFAHEDGSILFGVHNRLGAPQLAGAADPFTGQSWDGPNEYPDQPVGRGFTRAEVELLLEQAGLQGRILSVAPDLVDARMVFDDAMLEIGGVTRGLAWQVPSLPTPDLHGDRALGPDELRLWRSLVDAGVGQHFAPAFLVIASRGTAHQRWWPDHQLGAFWTMQRRARYCAESRVVRRPDLPTVPGQSHDVHIERTALVGSDGQPATAPHFDEAALRFRPDGSPVLSGVSIQEILSGCPSGDDAKPWVEHYAAHVADLSPDEDGRLPADAVPFNLLLLADGSLEWIDQEWWMAGITRQDVLGRGLLAATLRLAQRGTIALWGGGVLGEVALGLGRLAGFQQDDWLARAIVLDASIQTQVCHRAPGASDTDDVQRRIREQLVGMLQSTIAAGPGRSPGRHPDRVSVTPGAVAHPTATATPKPAGFRLGRG